jgi:RNA polymerase sigma factor (sigma-70 family)
MPLLSGPAGAGEETQTDDAEAAARARDGDLDAFELLVARYATVAHRTAALLGGGDEAADIVQEAFVKAFRGMAGFHPDAPFRPWLLRIVANETHNAQRSAHRRAAAHLRLVSDPVRSPARSEVSPELEAVAAERRAALLAAVRELPERDRLVITCRYFLELDEAETAAVLGWPRGSVKSRLSRALRRLRLRLDEEVRTEVRDV